MAYIKTCSSPRVLYVVAITKDPQINNPILISVSFKEKKRNEDKANVIAMPCSIQWNEICLSQRKDSMWQNAGPRPFPVLLFSTEHHLLITIRGGTRGPVVALDCWPTGRASDWSSARGMIHNKIHLVCLGCLQPSIALTVQNRGLKQHSFTQLIAVYSHGCEYQGF